MDEFQHVCNITQLRHIRTTSITRWGLQGPKFYKPRMCSQTYFSVAPSHQAIVVYTCVQPLRNIHQTTFMSSAWGQRVGRHLFPADRRPGHNFGSVFGETVISKLSRYHLCGGVIKQRSPDEAVFGVLCSCPSTQPSTPMT